MAILTLQKRQTEVGRIRLGIKVPTDSGKERPVKLDRLRFTSPRKTQIEDIARHYGGEVRLWERDRGNAQWEVITDATEVPVLVPPQDPGESQWLEMWTKGGCKRRCDGVTEKLSGEPCMCDPDPARRECSMHTRIQVMLKDIEGAHVWRVETGSFYAATELPGIAKILAASKGIIPGRLILDQRSVVRDGKTKKFAVPVLDVDGFTPAQLLSGRVPELAAQRLAAAIDGVEAPAAIGSGPDLAGIVRDCESIEELQALWERAGNDGVLDDRLRQEFKDRGAEIREAQADDVVDAEIVEEPGW